jgi:hypothetical protein
MSSHRSGSSRTSSRSGGRLTKRVRIIKVVDSLIQGFLFVAFIYFLDPDAGIPYRIVLFTLLGWQILSCIVNFRLSFPGQLKIPRTIYLVSTVVYLVCFFYFNRQINEEVIKLKIGEEAPLPIKEIIFVTTGLAISVYYNIVCFREIKKLQKRMDDGM